MENRKKSLGLCVFAFVLGLLVATLTGCATTTEAKVHAGNKTYAGAVGIGVRMDDSVKN